MLSITGLLLTSLTTTEKVRESLNGGVPLSVTLTVTELVLGPCASFGFQVSTPVEASTFIPCMALHAFNNAVSFGFTKSLQGWGIALLIVGSVAAVVSIGLSIVRRGGSPAAVTA